MDIQKLQTFVDLATTLSFTNTANNLFLTQATVTKHIQALEKELAVALFVRNQHQVQLTKAGSTILKSAQDILAAFRSMRNSIEALNDAAAHDLHVTTIPTITNYQAFSVLTNFRRLNPDVNMQLQELESQNLRQSLEQGASDLIFMRTFGNDMQNLEIIVTENDKFVAVLPVDHELAHANAIELAQLTSNNLLVLGEKTNMYQPFLTLAKQAAINPQITYHGERIDLILDLVNSGMGIGVLMDKSVNLDNYPRLVRVPLREQLASQLVFARKQGAHTPASDRVWKFLQATFATPKNSD